MKRTFLLISISILFINVFSQQNSKIKKEQTGIEANLVKYKSLFSDNLYSQLSKKTNLAKVSKVENPLLRETLLQMFNGTYSLEFRVQDYKKYLHPELLAKQLKTSTYSQFENPTGIYFTKDEEIVVIVENTDDEIQLQIANFGKEGGNSTYELSKGINTIVPTNSGNGYIQYFSNTPVFEKKNVKIHVIGGKVNGYFDIAKHNNQDWEKFLNSAPGEIMDIIGRRVQLAYSVESLKKYCPDDGVLLTSLYDSIISIQHDIMGLNKYNRVPDNHMFGRVIWQGFMHADGIGAAFHDDVMVELANPDKIKNGLWGIAHEFGHVNQVRPWMKWVGTTEVTNNIFSVWAQYLFDPHNPKLEREVLKDYDGDVAGGRITSYMESAFINKQQWLTQAGPDRWDRHRPRDWGGDHFVKLVPLWQLQLYYVEAGKGNKWYQPDFYADIYIKAIDRDRLPENDAEAQLDFIKSACDAAQTDLTDFFTQSGLLLPIDLWVDDYSCAQMTITDENIRNIKQYASKYKKPETPVLHYITANSISYFKDKLPIVGEYNKGIVVNNDDIIVNHNIWRNVVAFETYDGDKMIKIAFGGAGSNDNKSTLVRFPDNATKVEAVAWDGKRHLVYERRL